MIFKIISAEKLKKTLFKIQLLLEVIIQASLKTKIIPT